MAKSIRPWAPCNAESHQSAGGRTIPLVEYGDRQNFQRRANYSSACGAGDPAFYAKKGPDAKPVLLLVGGIHGGEMEGIAAILNLLRILESGKDLRGISFPDLFERSREVRWLIIPCLNPDGRARVPFSSVWDMDFTAFRRYSQGTWKDGTLCGYPECKSVHPIRDHCDQLGSYFNDDGVNIMHDRFFTHMADETRSLLALAEREAVDFTLQLHGGSNCANHFIPTHFLPESIKWQHQAFNDRYGAALAEKGLAYRNIPLAGPDGNTIHKISFNLASALHHVCGGMSMVYESNQNHRGEGVHLNPEQILESHLLLFTEMVTFALARKEKATLENA